MAHPRRRLLDGWRRLPRWPLLTATLPLLIVGIRAAGAAGDATVVDGDYAVLELGTRSALHFEQLLGPYSRYFWNHPGPALYDLLAPAYAVTGTEPGGMGLGAVLGNLVMAAVIVVVADRAGGRRWAWVLATTLAAFAFAYGPAQLADPWNPTMTVLPAAALVVVGAALATGRPWALPLLAATSTVAVQVHVGTAVVVAVVSGAAVVAALIGAARAASWQPWAVPAMVTAGVLAVLWAAPVYEQLTHEPGNLGQLLDFATDPGGPPHGWQESFETATELVVGIHRPVGRVVRETGPTTPLPDLSTSEWVLAAGLAAGLVVGLVAGLARGDEPAERRDRFGAALAALAGLAWGASVVSARRTEGNLFLYLVSFSSGVGIVVWAAVAGVVASQVSSRLPASAARWAAGAALAAAVLVAAGATRGALPLHRYASPELAALVRSAGDAAIADGADEVRVRILDAGQWPVAAAVAAAVEDRGIETTVEAPWTFMFGDQRAPSDEEEYLLSVGRVGQRPPTADDEELARVGEAVLFGSDEVHAGSSAAPADPPG